MHLRRKSTACALKGSIVTLSSVVVFGCGLSLVVSPQAAWAGNANKISCVKAGPQAPRDITSLTGSNAIAFAKAPPAGKMNLCDIHFHKFAEHRASGYTQLTGKGDHKGYVCNGHAPKAGAHKTGGHGPSTGCGGIENGDTVEVHWVFTTCDVKPGPTLGSCFSDTCKNPQLRVEARVFYLSDKKPAGNFGSFSDYSSGRVSVPAAKGAVEYSGSTTGSGYNDGTCSPFKVTWNVSSSCTPLQTASINNWCGKDKNAFKEDHAHGVRLLVKDAKLLSPIK